MKQVQISFPHYTWGYIAALSSHNQSKEVPSLYVRVYRAIYWQRTQDASSLTIREGISSHNGSQILWRTFPHYTWGYIAVLCFTHFGFIVPSLYVRVYRTKLYSIFITTRSLTIREGISLSVSKSGQRDGFPHYTWGYIDITNGRRTTTPVPSLYVRVYRTENEVLLLWDGSFTIRDGISKRNAKKDAKIAFPHYMWGYIGHFRFFQNPAY